MELRKYYYISYLRVSGVSVNIRRNGNYSHIPTDRERGEYEEGLGGRAEGGGGTESENGSSRSVHTQN